MKLNDAFKEAIPIRAAEMLIGMGTLASRKDFLDSRVLIIGLENCDRMLTISKSAQCLESCLLVLRQILFDSNVSQA